MLTPEFDQASHTYKTPEGRPLISVTQALSKAGLIDSTWFTERAAWSGSVVHRVTELWDKGILKESSVDPAAMPYLDAWREFCHSTGFKPIRIEVPRFHPTLLYAGCPDCDNDDIVVDRKTGASQPWHAIQLALYANFHPQARSMKRYTVRLQANGRYSVKQFNNFSTDLAAGLSAVNIAHWKGHNGC